jgi:hypothetical protein
MFVVEHDRQTIEPKTTGADFWTGLFFSESQ